MEGERKRFLYVYSHGIDTPDRTATPIYLATTAALMDHEVTIFFTARGTSVLRKGVAEAMHVKEGGMPLRSFIDQARDAGVRFVVCAASLELNEMTREDLVDDVDEIVGGASFNEMAAGADVVVSF